MPSGLTSHPPVSISMNDRPFHSASYLTRSRVTPGVSSTIASRRPMIRLTKVDFPTLGRPIIATFGSPSRDRSLAHCQITSTTSSKSRSVESISKESSAIRNGEIALVESIRSRSCNPTETSSTLESSASSRSRLNARC